MNFDSDFELLTGNPPFPWQRRMYLRFRGGEIPRACDLPTGLGKTSVIHIWLLALISNPELPRRLVYVVNRRTVVDQATDEVERLVARLSAPDASHLRTVLGGMTSISLGLEEAPLAISTLRGERADNTQWRRDPARPAVVVGTVDMIGSRLLFSGYGCGFKTKPLHAGFLGQDSLIVHDESHLEPAFQQLLNAIRDEQTGRDVRPIRVLALSATGRETPDFTLSKEDEEHPVVRARLQAAKGLRVHPVNDRKELPERAAKAAADLSGKVLVFLSSVEHVEKCAATLRKVKGNERVRVLTGTMRGAERDALVKTPVFARFVPRPPEGVVPCAGDVYLVATSAGEVGIDLSSDHLVSDLVPFDALAQRLGRVNRYGAQDSFVEVFCEPLTVPKSTAGDAEQENDDDESGSASKKMFEDARFRARELLDTLPLRRDDRFDASPRALRALPAEARRAASTPEPAIHSVDEMLFDRWSYTTLIERLPGRPPVAEWLHGVAEWEPPRTSIAWRREVAWLTPEHLGSDSLTDFLADYPLRSREVLNDRTDRVLKHLKTIAERDPSTPIIVWLVNEREVRAIPLDELIDEYEPNRKPLLHDATVILPPEAGGLHDGLFDGAAKFEPTTHYDIGAKEGERVIVPKSEALAPPEGMRLVRAIRRSEDDDADEGDDMFWQLYAKSSAADDDGSRNSRKKQTLEYHLGRTEQWAARLTDRIRMNPSEQRAIVRAAAWHDLGKARRVWQRAIRNFGDPALAKGNVRPADLASYRHELGSLHDATAQSGFADLSNEECELALHVIAAHHGRGRPLFPAHESLDPRSPEQVTLQNTREVPLRFDRLQRKYGRWGLAWLESIVRAADYLASDDEEELS